MNTSRVKDTIRRYVGREHCTLTGRGTTAIHLALKTVERRAGPGEVVLPTVACPSLAQMVLYAGFEPVFADVRADDFTLDADSFREKITQRTRAVLPVHLFGYAAPMADICAVARERGVFIIEDAAQSLGGSCDGRKMGAHGDFSILSFGGEKILDAGAGGAVLTDDSELAAAIEEEARGLPSFNRSPDYALRSLSHRNLYHALVDLLRIDAAARVDDIFLPAVRFYEGLYLQAFPEDEGLAKRIVRGFETLDDDNARRIERAARYESLLASAGGDLLLPSSWKGSGVAWRYSFLFKDAAKTRSVTSALRRNGIHASNHYWSAADLFYGEKSAPATGYVCPRLVNLWVDAVATDDYVARSCDIILRALD
jgi:dTDP-4-amino-4,6-dideoxygalactose transaminase